MVIRTVPVLPELSCKITLSVDDSYENDVEIVPICSPIVTTTRKLHCIPPVVILGIEVSASQNVRSEALPQLTPEEIENGPRFNP